MIAISDTTTDTCERVENRDVTHRCFADSRDRYKLIGQQRISGNIERVENIKSIVTGAKSQQEFNQNQWHEPRFV